MVEKVNEGADDSKNQQACKGLTNKTPSKCILTLLPHFIFQLKHRYSPTVSFTAQRHTPTSTLQSVTSIVTTRTGQYMCQPKSCEITGLRSSTVSFYIHSFIHCIIMSFIIPLMMIAAIQKQTVTKHLSIHSFLQSGLVLMVLNTWTTISQASPWWRISISSTMK